MRERTCLGLAVLLLVCMMGAAIAKPMMTDMEVPGYGLESGKWVLIYRTASNGDDRGGAMEQAGPDNIMGNPGQAMGMGMDRPMSPMESPMDKPEDQGVKFSFHNWRGFALRDNESHALRISVNSIQSIDPMEVRRLLESNLTLQEIRSRISEQDRAANRGGIRLGQDIYPLLNIVLHESDEEPILEADVVEPQFSDVPGEFEILPLNETAIVGHLTLNPAVEESEVIEGTLTINSTRYSGTFKLLVENFSKERIMMGHRPGEFVEKAE